MAPYISTTTDDPHEETNMESKEEVKKMSNLQLFCICNIKQYLLYLVRYYIFQVFSLP